MNVHDSELVGGLLEREGYRPAEDIADADVVIINTCTVRVKAEEKAHSLIGRLRALKRARPGITVGVMGCLAQQWGEEFFSKFPHLDFVCGTHALDVIPGMVLRLSHGERRLSETAFRQYPGSLSSWCVPRSPGPTAYVNIMQGCDNFCAYCIVPYVRGRERSRPPGDVIEEVKALAAGGVKEVTLLGQNVNSYGKGLTEKTDFPDLLKRVSAVRGIERIRFTTSHPRDLSESLMNAFVEIDALCEHIHLPFQAGSDSVLRRMRRGYTAEGYLRKIDELRRRVPDISLSTDIIVGFPGERDEDFEKTIDLMGKVRFDNSFSFKYSDRSGTVAASFGDKVDEAVKSERLVFLQSLQRKHTLEKNRQREGMIEEVLVEGPSKGGSEDVTGRTRGNRIVNFRGDDCLRGKTVLVNITRGYAHSLRGEMVQRGEIPLCLSK